MLHIHCGDSSAKIMKMSGLPGEVIVWCDMVCEGPLPGDMPDAARRAIRAKYVSDSTRGALASQTVVERFRKEDEALEKFSEHDEAVLWFDACLFDQSILVRQLDWFSRRDLGKTKLSLVCVGEFPGMERFCGLGDLMPKELASLFDKRHEVTAAEKELARQAYAALRSPDPTAIEKVREDNTSVLPYLDDALMRYLQQYPSVRNGLNRLQNSALKAVATGHFQLVDIFVQIDHREDRPFVGDTTLWQCLDGMASGRHPLIFVNGPGRLPLWNPPRNLAAWEVLVTETGIEVLEGKKDWIELNGINRWMGGVHLAKGKPIWLWDEDERKLVKK
jgi:hypothetical protein